MSKTIQAIIYALTRTLSAQYDPLEANSIAWELVTFVTGKSKTELLLSASISTAQQAQIEALLKKHLNESVPIAYLTNSVLFGDLQLSIRPPILIPRSETEEWCYKLIALLKPFSEQPLQILELCTGSGCIALALAHALPKATVVGVDIDPGAISLAAENSKRLGVTNCSWLHADLFSALACQQFDLIIANPPYIGHHESDLLDRSVRDFESPEALFAADDGYAIIKEIVSQAPSFIRYNQLLAAHHIPQLLIEIGAQQSDIVYSFLCTHNYVNIELWKDYQDHNRVACARVAYGETPITKP